jgi:hypothetical protein
LGIRRHLESDKKLFSFEICLTEKDTQIKEFKEIKSKKSNRTQINRKLRVATKIESTFLWFLTSYRAAEKQQNDYLSSA